MNAWPNERAKKFFCSIKSLSLACPVLSCPVQSLPWISSIIKVKIEPSIKWKNEWTTNLYWLSWANKRELEDWLARSLANYTTHLSHPPTRWLAQSEMTQSLEFISFSFALREWWMERVSGHVWAGKREIGHFGSSYATDRPTDRLFRAQSHHSLESSFLSCRPRESPFEIG